MTQDHGCEEQEKSSPGLVPKPRVQPVSRIQARSFRAVTAIRLRSDQKSSESLMDMLGEEGIVDMDVQVPCAADRTQPRKLEP